MIIEAIDSLIVILLPEDQGNKNFRQVEIKAGESIMRKSEFQIADKSDNFDVVYEDAIVEPPHTVVIQERFWRLNGKDGHWDIGNIKRDAINQDPRVNTRIRWVDGE